MSMPQDYQQSLHRFCDSEIKNITAYRNNQSLGHINALRNNFIVVKELLGDSTFNALASVYFEYYPATHWDINIYGEHFAELVLGQQHSGKSSQFNWVLISQVTSIEYALVKAYYSPLGSHFRESLVLQNSDNILPTIANFHPYVSYTERSLSSNKISIERKIEHDRFSLFIDTDRAPK